MAKVLVVGAGGREHALATFLARSPAVEEVFTAPGNAGTPNNVAIEATTPRGFAGLVRFIRERSIDLTVVGPEAPLCAGLADFLREQGLLVFGPSRQAARLESDKAFARAFMRRHRIPHPDFAVCRAPEEALAHLRSRPDGPVVVKASGLAQGKGVYVCEDRGQAEKAVRALMEEKVYGAAGEAVVIEQFLEGEEATITAVTDGRRVVYLASSQDHKRAFDGDRGPNTGGMGTYAPAPVVTETVRERVDGWIVRPTLEGMAREGAPYSGCLYVGLMIHEERPTVVEFNCRFGDPETQPVLPLLDGDFYELLRAAACGDLRGAPARQRPGAAACVVLTSGGYPDRYETGKVIDGLEEAGALADLFVFHAGTRRREDGRIVSAGGRVLGITGLGPTIGEAVRRAYAGVERISFEGCHFRRDIGHRALRAAGGGPPPGGR